MRRGVSLAFGAAIVLAAVALLTGLGFWQLRRLAWKESLIAEVSARVTQPPVDAPLAADWPSLKPDNYEYRHIRLTGVYDLAHQALVFRPLSNPRGRWGGPGYLVMTPLKLASGESVIVNRGFVPDEKQAAAATGPAGETTITGLMRATEDRTWFTPGDDPVSGRWFTRDVPALARALKAEPHAPFFVDADSSGAPEGLPEGGETILAFPNSHLSYAVTWFGMALALVGVYAAWVFSARRGRDEDAG